jgi:hypothetical protein
MTRRTNGEERRSNILVSVEDKALGRIDAIAAELRANGMAVAEVLPLTGLVTGAADDGDLAKLRNVAGVSSLEIDPMFTAS